MVHIPATISFMAYSYRYFQPQVFQSTRRTLVVCNGIAFILFSLWPCMPPRLLPYNEFGYEDTLHKGKAASIWTTNRVSERAQRALSIIRSVMWVIADKSGQFQNQLAAFPSLHFGYSFVM